MLRGECPRRQPLVIKPRVQGQLGREINCVLECTLDTGWESKEAISLRAVDELIASHRICSDTRHTLAKYFTDAQLMDVIAILGM